MEFAVLRVVHLLFGSIWAGGAIAMGLFVIPALGQAGPAAGAVMQGPTLKRFPVVMTVAGAITVLAGLRLYMLKFSMVWLGSPEGIAMTLGGLLGLAAFGIGVAVQRPAAMKLGALGAEVRAAGKPTPEQAEQMAALQKKLGRVGAVMAWHMVAALSLMSLKSLVMLF